MHLLGELAEATWRRLEDLLKDFDQSDNERQVFVEETRHFFAQRLAIYEQQRNELENHLKQLTEQMYQLFDELQLPRMTYDDHHQMTLIDKRKAINEKIEYLKNLIFERDKELIRLRQTILIKAKFIENYQINTDQILSTTEAYTIISDLTNQLNNLKQDVRNVFNQIHSFNPAIASNHQTIVHSFLSLNDENESLWLTTHQPVTASSLYSRLLQEYEQLREVLLTEIVGLRLELDQNEPDPPVDLQQELADLRLRKRYLSLLTTFPHKLTSRSTLEQIRQTYEKLTASLRAQAREKLKLLWDELDVPDSQRVIPRNQANEDDYLAMNDEIQRLQSYVESIRSLLTKIQKREWYKKEMVEFEKRTGDPARLRGSSTQLLKEERFRKDLSREFPKLTDDLRRTVAEWEESSRRKLIYGGEPYLETMNKEKLSVDFHLLHLRLLTKCQVLVQPTKDDASSVISSTPSLPPTPKATSRIPTMSFTNSNRKLNKQT